MTVACVFVQGEFPYTVDYVTRLRAMVHRWMDRPFRFVCLTDRPWLMPEGVEPIIVQKLQGFAPWTKLELFNPARAWRGRMLYLDLDTLIVSPLSELIDRPSAFAITADPPAKAKPKTRDSFGHRIVRRFNSSVMVWDGGTQTDLYTKWLPATSGLLSGDQDWIGEQKPDADAMPREWFPRISEVTNGPDLSIPDAAKVVLCKVPKNHLAVERWPWLATVWA